MFRIKIFIFNFTQPLSKYKILNKNSQRYSLLRKYEADSIKIKSSRHPKAGPLSKSQKIL